jgi:O-methyltransferase involved in polyketide biosynthesis
MAFEPPAPSPAPAAEPPRLDPLESTLLIPLTARALGERLFPRMAVHDAHAAAALAGLQAQVDCFLQDRLSIYGVLARTRIIRRLAQGFFERHPLGWGLNLGCGLACYFQWLDNGRNHWLDADLPHVMQLRQQLLVPPGPRHREATLDLRCPHWWQTLGLPKRKPQPVLLLLEGVLMYQTADQVRQVLREFAEHAPPGSELISDSLSWLAVGAAAHHPSVCHTGAQFRWGPRRMSDFTEAHPRLRLLSEHAVLDGYNAACAWMCASFRAVWGVPVYGVVRLGLNDAPGPALN